MKIEIDFTKNVAQNANDKYKLRGKYRKKMTGLDQAVIKTKQKIEKVKSNEIKVEEDDYKVITQIKKKWYEKFRWFFTTNKHLVIAGKDAKNNEQLVKKHLEDEDLYFHADVFGAPHTIIKNSAKITDLEKDQAAAFALCFSSAWKNKLYSAQVYSVSSQQVSKTANAGESLGTGAFVIRGKREYFTKLKLELGVGYFKDLDRIMVAPKESIKKHCSIYYIIVPGDLKKSDVAKELLKKFEDQKIKTSLDNLISLLPSGESTIQERN